MSSIGARALVRGYAKIHEPQFAMLSFVLKARALRCEFFPSDLFADPAWDILLDLYEASLMQIRLSVSKIGQGTNLPATTVLRWIKALEAKGFVERYEDPYDRRRVYIDLSIRGHESMRGFFAGIKEWVPA